MQPRTHLLVGYQTVEDGQYLLAVGIDTLQVLAEAGLEIVGPHPLLEHGPRYVDVLPQRFYVMSPEEEPVKEGGFPLGRQGIEIVSRRHKRLSENVSIPVARTSRQVLFWQAWQAGLIRCPSGGERGCPH
ncbi:hypothetical protein SBA6_590087 [Candidatus Sulfopaludibacter sp. SbA6]|nr:hypothetical protein SBA6_590087 [Candidatus Sulfopaludibacter sp. SbA6]